MSGAARKRRAKAQPTKRSTKAKTSPAEKRAPAKAASRNSLIFASFRNAPGCLPVSPYDGGHNHVHILQVTSKYSLGTAFAHVRTGVLSGAIYASLSAAIF